MPSSSDQTQNYFASKKPEYVHAAILKSLATGQLVRSDADIITEFLAERKSAGGIGLSRTNKVAFTLIGWRRFLPPFSELTMGAVYTGIETLKHGHHPGNRRGGLHAAHPPRRASDIGQ